MTAIRNKTSMELPYGISKFWLPCKKLGKNDSIERKYRETNGTLAFKLSPRQNNDYRTNP